MITIFFLACHLNMQPLVVAMLLSKESDVFPMILNHNLKKGCFVSHCRKNKTVSMIILAAVCISDISVMVTRHNYWICGKSYHKMLQIQ